MPRTHKYMFWIDLETTGSDLDENDIIEIGAAITDMELNVLDTRQFVLPISHERLEFMHATPWQMHTKNGLIHEALTSTASLGEVDKALADWVRKFNGSNHMILAGSGVTHFDRQFIKRDLPLLNKRLTYYAIDVGSDRRVFTLLAGADWPMGDDQADKTHRALEDVYFHISECKYVVDTIKRGLGKE